MIAASTTAKVTLLGAISVALITVLVLLEPALTIVGGVALALTTLCTIPALFAALAPRPALDRGAGSLQRR